MSVQSLSKSVVAQGCIGECGSPVTVPYIVTDEDTKKITVKTVETSLCGNTGAFAFVFRNGKLADQGIITKLGSTLMTKAEKGDNIVVFATLFPLFNGIVCIRLGNLDFHLIAH